MLIAATHAIKRLGHKWSNELFLTGYSQGGHATLALHKYLETDPELRRRFTVTASLPMAGPHDPFHTCERVMNQPNPDFSAATTAFNLLGRDHVSKIWPKVTDYLKPEYAKAAWTTFTGESNVADWWEAFAGTEPRSMLTAKANKELFRGDALRKDSAYAKNLLANATYVGWRSSTPICLIHGADDDVTPRDINANGVFDAMRANGFSNVSLTLVSGDHQDCGHTPPTPAPP